MTLAEEAERTTTASQLAAYTSSIAGSISALIAHKAALGTLKTAMQAKTTIYSTEDCDECDTVIATIATGIATI